MKQGYTMAFGMLGGACLSTSIANLIQYYSKIDSLRDAIYAHADKITPEVIEKANNLGQVLYTDINLIRSAVSLGGAGLCAFMAYHYAKHKEE